MSDNGNEVQEGAKGEGRYRRKGDLLKQYILGRRPRKECPEEWTDYRSVACIATHEAAHDNAPAEVQARIREEYEAAVSALRRLRPSTLENLAACNSPFTRPAWELELGPEPAPDEEHRLEPEP